MPTDHQPEIASLLSSCRDLKRFFRRRIEGGGEGCKKEAGANEKHGSFVAMPEPPTLLIAVVGILAAAIFRKMRLLGRRVEV
jgi:hypothetical protein